MHRAGVNHVGRTMLRLSKHAPMRMRALMRSLGRGAGEKAARLGHEFCATAGGTEIIGVALMLGLVFGRGDVDVHPANRVARLSPRQRRVGGFRGLQALKVSVMGVRSHCLWLCSCNLSSDPYTFPSWEGQGI